MFCFLWSSSEFLVWDVTEPQRISLVTPCTVSSYLVYQLLVIDFGSPLQGLFGLCTKCHMVALKVEFSLLKNKPGTDSLPYKDFLSRNMK